MRSNVVFFVLLALSGVLVISLVMRPRQAHELKLPASASGEAANASSGAPSASASGAPSASLATSAPASADAGDTKPSAGLGRVLRVTALGWELAAPAILANGGLEPKKDGELGKAGLDVAISVSDDADAVERSLARGGADESGADIALVPLPSLVASWEHLRALEPAVFQVTAWSRGREVVTGKQAFDKLPASGEIHLAGEAAAPATALALFCLDLAGVAPARVKLVDRGDSKAELSARARSSVKAEEQSNTLVTSAEASRFVPIVAVASAPFVAKHGETLAAFSKAWLAGQKELSGDATSAARTIAALKDAPEPVELMARLGELEPTTLAENAELLGLSGRSAISVQSLFQRTWRLERDTKLLTVPAPERAPVAPAVIASLVRANPELSRSEPAKAVAGGAKRPAATRPLLIARVADSSFDDESVSAELGFVAGVFARSPVRVSAYRGGAADKTLAASVIRESLDRYALAEGRLIPGNAPARPGAVASFEIMPIP